MENEYRKRNWITVGGVLILVFSSLTVGICRTDQAIGAEIVDRIVAVVNDDIIPLTEFEKNYNPLAEKIKDYGYPPDEERQMMFKLRESILNQMIEKKLTEQEIIRLSINVSEEELDSAIERIKEKNLMTDEDIRKRLRDEGLTMEEYRSEMKGQILRAKLVEREVKSNIVITDKDLENYYEEHQDEFGGDTRYHLRNIIMKVGSSADEEEKKAVSNRMEAVMERLENGESFEELARQYSESPFAAEGGDLGFFNKKDLTPQIQAALEKISSGQYTGILETEQGYQIFFLAEVSSDQGKTMEEVKPLIEEKLYNQMMEKRFKKWVADLRKNSHIKIMN
ncbi:MAG: peptidylprolyl isomerase [Thermodesulfobacteriota bacterium]